MIRFLYGLCQLARPLEWSKSFGNMLIAAVTAGLVLGIPLSAERFLLGFLALALLWSGLYALNDYTDRKADALHSVKKQRAIPSGTVSANAALLFSLALIAISFLIAFSLNGTFLFMLCMAAMLLNQFLYTMKPVRLKRRPIVDLISGSLINPIFRFYAGWVLFVPAFNAPGLVLLFILGIQFGGFGLYRMASKGHEEKLGMRSSVVLFGERKLRWVAYFSLLLGAQFYLAASLLILPFRYFLLGIAMVFPVPLYKAALRNPQKIDMEKMYWLIYLHYLVFLAGFLLLYLFPF